MGSEDMSVVVGVCPNASLFFREEREGLARMIEDCGYNVQRVNDSWPRDRYIFYDGRYLTKRDAGTLGEGGYFQFAPDFILVSDLLLGGVPSRSLAEREVSSYFPSKHVYGIHCGECRSSSGDKAQPIGHIDLTCLVIPSRRLLIFDSVLHRLGAFENIRNYFFGIGERENYSVEFYESKESFKLYPLNCLVLPNNNDGELVFANRCDSGFLGLLSRYDVEFVTVPVHCTPMESGGSIRCCTNIKELSKPINELIFPEKVINPYWF